MKSAILLLGMTVIFFSCARKDNECKSRENMVIECRAVAQPNYGYAYAQELCNRTYSANKCY